MGILDSVAAGFSGSKVDPSAPPPATTANVPKGKEGSVAGGLKTDGDFTFFNGGDPAASLLAASNRVLNNTPDEKREITTLGAPPFYPPNADLYKRTFMETLAVNAPVVTIIPGTPGIMSDAAKSEKRQAALASMFKKVNDADNTKDQQAILAEINRSMQFDAESLKESDGRFFSFSADPLGYSAAFNTLFSGLVSRLEGTSFIVENTFESDKWGGLNFYVDKGTTVSEGISNSYEDSFMKGMMDGAASMVDKAKEAMGTLLGDGQSEFFSYADKGEKMVGAATGGAAATTGTLTRLSSVFEGSKALMPKMWSDSTFNRSYTISMKFESLYGNKEDLINDVFLPFLAVLAFSLPMQSHTSAYSRPFILQVDAAGWFHLDCAVVTEVTIKRSASPDDWTDDGLSRKIELDLTVMDLYPTIMLSQHMFAATNNIGLNSYLSSIAGMNYKQINVKSYWNAFQTAATYYYNRFTSIPKDALEKLTWERRNLASWFRL
jgi:hypothetical protein